MPQEQSRLHRLTTLFLNMLYISAFTFGGGFVITSFMKKRFVDGLHWIDESEMLDLVAIAQSSPGPIPINASVILGYRMCGIPGSVTAILGTALPPMLIISVIAHFYAQFRSSQVITIALQVMRAGVAAVIFDVVINLATNVIKTRRFLYISLMTCAFLSAVVLNVNAVLIILFCLAVGICDLCVSMKKLGGARA